MAGAGVSDHAPWPRQARGMKRSHRDTFDILALSPWVAAHRLARLPANPFSLESALAWQQLAMEKWLGACEAGASAFTALFTTTGPHHEHLAAALAAPIARRVRTNARGLARPRRSRKR